jgi:uncharacterized membrane protein
MVEEENKKVNPSLEQAVQRTVYADLPPPEVLQAYEEIVPGTTKKLLQMAEREQQHRHAWEDAYLIRQTKSYRIGQLFGFVAALVIIILASILAISDKTEAATIVAVPGLLVLTATSILAYLPKKYSPPPKQ